MALYQDNLIVEQTLTQSALVTVPTNTVAAAGTLALTAASTMSQLINGSTAGQIVKLPDATTLVLGQRYEVFNGATVTVSLQDGSGASLVTIQPAQLVVLRLISNATQGGVWGYNAIDQSMSAQDELLCSYPGTGLSVNYQAGVVYINGTEYAIAAGSITVPASTASGFIYVDPTTHAPAVGSSLPNNAIAMAIFVSSASAVTSLNDSREFAARNLVWGLTSDIQAQTSQSTASAGSLEKYARADHKHAMNIPLIKSGLVANTSFTGTTQKTAAVVFATAYADANYSVNITGTDGRSWIVTAQSATGFTVNSQAAQSLTGNVMWEAIKVGEAS
jgi:hypothetical protein